MPAFAILTTRKRAIIALVHTVAFLGLAVHDYVAATQLTGIVHHSPGSGRSLAFGLVYLAVASVLGYLLALCRCATEQVYFALCTASASTGLLRALVGDHSFHAGQLLRVFLLTAAVLTGALIVRYHQREAAAASRNFFLVHRSQLERE